MPLPSRCDRLVALTGLVAVCAGGLAGQDRPPEVRLLGFADFNYVASNRPGTAEGFRSGQVAGHLAAELTPRLSFFGEATATPSAAGFTLEVERAILRHAFSDRFRLSAGRYHTPISYWNTAFHHGQWLQTTAGRPEMIKFGGSVLPVHFVGVLAEGTLWPSVWRLGYVAGLGNGRHANISRGGDAGDVNDRRAWTLGLEVRPTALRHLLVGAAVYIDRVTPAPAVAVAEALWTAHVVWSSEEPEVVTEYLRARHRTVAGAAAAVESEAGYVQVAYRLPVWDRVLKPYARVERVDVPAADPLLGALGLNYSAALVGVRYDFAPVAALKAEYRRERAASAAWFDTYLVQLAFTFPGWQEPGPLGLAAGSAGTRAGP